MKCIFNGTKTIYSLAKLCFYALSLPRTNFKVDTKNLLAGIPRKCMTHFNHKMSGFVRLFACLNMQGYSKGMLGAET